MGAASLRPYSPPYAGSHGFRLAESNKPVEDVALPGRSAELKRLSKMTVLREPRAKQLGISFMKLILNPQWKSPSTDFRHTWEGVINVDQFRWLVRRDLQEQLALAQKELRARHVRAVGMYDDEMRVFCPSPESFMGYAAKDPRTNWQIVDYAMDSLQDLRLHPVFTTSFVPSAMASGPTTVFTTKGHTSPPKDLDQWAALVRESVLHAVERYSLDVVRQWYFEAWNEPNLIGWFWGGTKADYLDLWRSTYRAIKGVDASFRIGGPSTGKAEWVTDLLEFGQANDCLPDYLTPHIYNNDSSMGVALAPFDGPQEDRGAKSPNFSVGIMRGVRSQVDALGFKGELHWNEWGRSFHGIDQRRESPAEAAFIVRLLDRVSQTADAFAYWCISDIYDQVGYGREAFHGGYGLLSLQGLRKPAYHAFELLAKLGNQRVEVKGTGLDDLLGAIATTTEEGKQLLVHAYDHDDAPVPRSIDVSVDLPSDFGTATLFRVDRRENNVITQWKELGSPAYLSREQLRELKAVNALRPSPDAVRIKSDDGRVTAHFTMESPGLALLDLARQR